MNSLARIAVSIGEAAQLLGIGRTSVVVALRRGDLPRVKIGRRTVIPVSEISAFLDRHRRASQAADKT